MQVKDSGDFPKPPAASLPLISFIQMKSCLIYLFWSWSST